MRSIPTAQHHEFSDGHVWHFTVDLHGEGRSIQLALNDKRAGRFYSGFLTDSQALQLAVGLIETVRERQAATDGD